MNWDWLPEDSGLTLALTAAAALLAGLARGFSGFGAALIFVPLTGALVGPKLAGPILTVIDLIFAAPLFPGAFARGDRREVSIMFAGAAVGIPAGTAILRQFEPLTLRWLIAGMAASMLLLLLSGWRYRGQPRSAATIAVGAVSGLFSGIAQIGGPPVVSYWLGTGSEPAIFRANVILFFAAGGALSLVTYYLSGLISDEVLRISLLAGPAYGIGTYFGTRMFGLASPAIFRAASLILIALAVLLSLPLFG